MTDSGIPSLGATRSFLLSFAPLAKPAIATTVLAAGQLVLQVNGDSGPDYQIQAATNLVDWSAVFTTNAPALPFLWTNHSPGLPRRFFRVLVGPPLP